MLANYHTHSDWSDGQATMAAMIDAAVDAGFSEYGVSDHWTLHPAGETFWWSMHPGRLSAYLQALDDQQQRIGSRLVVRRGLEVDWFDGFGDSIARELEPFTFDYLIGSVHFVGATTVDESSERWETLDQKGVNAVHREFWRLVHDMARSGLFDIAAHLDVVKKFAFLPDVDLRDDINRALDAIAAADMVVELNTAGWFKPINDAYPSIDILRACAARSIPVTLSTDAHRPEDVTRGFVRGARRLLDAGHTHVARFANRTRTMEPIPDAIAGLPHDADIEHEAQDVTDIF